VRDTVQCLVDEDFRVGNFCYRALLAYLKRGPTESAQVLAALDETGVERIDEDYSWILRRDAEAIV